ncbi:hypothetical protein R3W88_024658 [Solanum pinnatisectum]|uniref:Uncharacterized protein n=1 Tax=Solanum pinnatisectum TaxID=50273 RepID=A0AAV9M3X9_9SOLN|nr:hypothetical protein R3W88_024658 [Solanum pinnatisectum]
MYHNNENSQLSQLSNNVLGLDDGDSLLSNDNKYDEDSDVGYGDDRHPYLDSDDEDLLNLFHEEMNMSNQAEQDESLSVSSGEEYGYEDEWAEEAEDANGDTFTDQQYIEDPVEGMIFCSVRIRLSGTLKRSLEAHDIVGIRPSKSIRFLKVQASGPDRIGCTPKDCRIIFINNGG